MAIRRFDESMKDTVTNIVDWEHMGLHDLRSLRYYEGKTLLVRDVDKMNQVLQLELRGAVVKSCDKNDWLIHFTNGSEIIDCLYSDIMCSSKANYLFK